jgi:hypothetical protein
MNIETLQAAERVSAWYRNRRVVPTAAPVSGPVVPGLPLPARHEADIDDPGLPGVAGSLDEPPLSPKPTQVS